MLDTESYGIFFAVMILRTVKKLKKVEKNYHFIFEALKLMRRMILYSMFNLRFCQRSNLFDQKRYMYIVDSAYYQLIS